MFWKVFNSKFSTRSFSVCMKLNWNETFNLAKTKNDLFNINQCITLFNNQQSKQKKELHQFKLHTSSHFGALLMHTCLSVT